MSSFPEWLAHNESPLTAPLESAGIGKGEDSDLKLLHGIAQRMAGAAPLSEVLADVVEFATAVVKCDSCFVYILEKDELILKASKNPHPEVINHLKLKLGQGITGWVAQHGQPVVIPRKAYADARFQLFNELPEDLFEAFLSVPILSRGRLVGVINLQNRASHTYRAREIGLISTIGFLVGADVEMARLESENSQLFARLETRKLVERAKGMLQRDLQVGEAEAYLLMQRESQQRRRPMKDIAEAIILSYVVRQGAPISGITACDGAQKLG